jgi:hypothetical protein
LVSEEFLSFPSSPRAFVNNEDPELSDMEGEAGHVCIGFAEIQDIFEDVELISLMRMVARANCCW